MNYEELLKMLEIDSPEEFEYFENFSELIESDAKIEEEALYKLFNGAQGEVVLDLIENYFEEIMDAIPDDSTDLYTLFETIKMVLIGLIENSDEEVALVHFCDEIENFKEWYSCDSKVICKSIKDGTEEILPIRDALALSRIEKLEGVKYHYDFSDCLDYKLEEYVMTYADMAKESRNDAAEDERAEEYDYGEYDNYDYMN